MPASNSRITSFKKSTKATAARLRTKRHAQSDLRGAAGDGIGSEPVQADRGQEQGQPPQKEHNMAIIQSVLRREAAR